MLSVRINNDFAVLPENASITFDLKSDLFTFDLIEGSLSYSFTFPFNRKNDSIFNYAKKIELSDNLFVQYDAAVYWKGNVLKIGYFVLQSTQGGYSGYFITDASILSPIKDKKIYEVVDKEITFSSTNISELENYTDVDSDLVFPILQFQKSFYNNYTTGSGFSEPIIPCFKVKYTIEAIFEQLGYTVEWNFTTGFSDFEKLTFFNDLTIIETKGRKTRNSDVPPDPLPSSINLKNHLPEMTVSELFNSLGATFGIKFTYDTIRRIAKAYLLDDVLKSFEYDEWTSKVIPSEEIFNNDYDGVMLSWSNDEEDEIIQADPETLTEYYEGESVVNIADLPTAQESNQFEFRLVQKINEYYYVAYDEDADTYSWEYLAHPHYPYQKDNAALNIQPNWMPAMVSNEQIVKFPFAGKITDTLGNVTITFGRINQSAPFLGGKVQLLNSGIYENDIFYDVNSGGNTATQSYIIIDLPYLGDEEGVEFERKQTVEYTPTVSTENTDYPRIFFYQGLQDKTYDTGDYPFGNTSEYGPGTAGVIGDFALRWNKEKGLEDFFWQTTLGFLQSHKQKEFTAVLNILDILNFNPAIKKLIRNDHYLITEMEVQFRNDGKIVTDRIKAQRVPVLTVQ